MLRHIKDFKSSSSYASKSIMCLHHYSVLLETYTIRKPHIHLFTLIIKGILLLLEGVVNYVFEISSFKKIRNTNVSNFMLIKDY